MARAKWLEGLERAALVVAVAEYFGDLNVIHPSEKATAAPSEF